MILKLLLNFHWYDFFINNIEMKPIQAFFNFFFISIFTTSLIVGLIFSLTLYLKLSPKFIKKKSEWSNQLTKISYVFTHFLFSAKADTYVASRKVALEKKLVEGGEE